MTRYHLNPETGNPGRCVAQEGNCKYGGSSAHYNTEAEARFAYETTQEALASMATENSTLPPSNSEKTMDRTLLTFERNKFFHPKRTTNYTMIDTDTGAVFSTHAVVMEKPEGDEYFYEHPEDFARMEAEFCVQPLIQSPDIRSYRNPVIVELDTGLVVGIGKDNIYAIDHGNEIVDFEEILDSDRAAAEAAHDHGFSLWG